VSRTDPGGRITFVNQAFVAISGFSEQELIGAPHNIVRHPHMPTAAFADLWATIKAGKPWEGLVKNRAKTGDFYWVRANTTPIVENGAIAGYISIRSKPTRAQIDEAERLYSIMRDSTASGITIREGEVRNLGWRHWIGRTAQSVAGRLTAAFSALILLSLAAGWLGLDGMADSNESLRTVYEDRTVTAGQIGEIASSNH
jgi:methyl-accepting chemotaxis protein/aerotaxis receptor